MKRHPVILLLISLLPLLTHCKSDRERSPEGSTDSTETVWTFTPMPADYRPSSDTRAITGDEDRIESLTLLVFRGSKDQDKGPSDHAGKTFLYASTATPNGDGTYTASLVPTSEPRIIHVIANYDFTGTRPGAYLDMDEGELIPRLTGSGSYLWCRIALPRIPDSGMLPIDRVELLRSRAKVSLTAARSVGMSEWSLKAIHAASVGTVAPFDPGSATFREGQITIPPETTYTATVTAAGQGEPLYLSERPYIPGDPLYIILRATIGGETQYYKIDLVSQDNSGIHRYDLIRNHHYVIHIHAIKKRGYKTEEEAIEGPPVNSTVLDYRMEAYPDLYSDDGTALLRVEQTTFAVGASESSFPTRLTYMIGEELRNDLIHISVVEEDPAHPLLTITESKDESGHFNGTLFISCSPLPEGYPSRSAGIYISAGSGAKEIHRVITVNQFAPFTLTPALINGADPAEIKTEMGPGQSAVLSFVIPDDYPEHLLPVPVTIETNTLNPESLLPLTTTEGRIQYTYMAKSKGRHEIRLKTTKSYSQEVVRLSAPNFLPAITGYNVGQFFGKLTYTYDGISRPLPRSSDRLTVSEGRILGPLPGTDDHYRYKLLLPIRLLEEGSDAGSESVHLSVRIPVDTRESISKQPAYRIFSTDIPLTELRRRYREGSPDPLDLDLRHTSTLIFGALSARNYPGQEPGQVIIPKESDLTILIRSSSDTEPVDARGKVFRDNTFELEYPADKVHRGDRLEVKLRRVELTERSGAVVETYEIEPGTDGLLGIITSRQISLRRSSLTIYGQCLNALHNRHLTTTGLFWYFDTPSVRAKIDMPNNGRYVCPLPKDLREDRVLYFQAYANARPPRRRTLSMLRRSTHLYFGQTDEWP